VHGARPSRRLGAIVGLFLVLIAAIVTYNATATNHERDQALVVNVASRQRALAERYITDVLLSLSGRPADPAHDAELLDSTAEALLHGGSVLAVQGADRTVRIPPVSTDSKVIAKLDQERRLIGRLIAAGNTLLRTGPRGPGFDAQLQRLRVLGGVVVTISNDAVGRMTLDAQGSLGRVVRVGVALGALGALAALLMGLLLRKAAQQQAAQFGALLHNSSDLITVVGADGTIRYESPAAERTLGLPVAEMMGRRLSDLVHPDEAPAVVAALDRLSVEAGSTVNLDHRRRAADGQWRHMESVATNLSQDPLVGGLVLNSRDVSERKRTERQLQVLQSERTRLLDRTVQATEQERRRLALELHDGPVQHLSALALKLERAELALGTVAAGAGPGVLVEAVRTRLQDEVQGLRRIMSELRPPALDERGLEAALQEHLNAVQARSGLLCTVESSIGGRLDSTQETVLYRVAQEALTNVAKHARAGHAWVTLQPVDGDVELQIRDDGVGFDPADVADLSRDGHFGLIGMRERVEMAGGRWDLASTPGVGTVVRAVFPNAAREPGLLTFAGAELKQTAYRTDS